MRRKIGGICFCMLLVAAALVPLTAAQNPNEPCIECASCSDPVVKWEQLPDMTQNGTDVCMVRNPNLPRVLADDFNCMVTGYVTHVRLWGSWLNDMKGVIKTIHLSFHEDIPANQSTTHYSMPGKLLWQANFSTDQFKESIYHDGTPEWWYDPYTGETVPNADHIIWQYDINISATNAFKQTGSTSKPVIYWLDVYVETLTGQFGWKTAAKHWNDDAVYYSDIWKELKYPPGHPLGGKSIDLAFSLTTTPICCFKVAFPRLVFLGVKAKVTETCNVSHTNVPWNITVSWGSTHKYYTGTIATIGPMATVTIASGTLFHFGSVVVTVKVDDCPPVSAKMMMYFLITIFIS